MRIFLSYASEDKSIAEPVAFALRNRGHRVFLDRDDLPEGGEYDARIERAVEQSDYMIFLISPSSVRRGRFTLTELEFARQKWRSADGNVMPVMVTETPLIEIPSYLKSVTILEPRGNIAAEVASAVASRGQSANLHRAALIGLAGLVSGVASPTIIELLGKALSKYGLDITFLGLSVSSWFFGILFASALVFSVSRFLYFRTSLLAIFVSVLVGWCSAVNFALSMTPELPNGSRIARSYIDQSCDEKSDDASNPSATIECLRRQLDQYRSIELSRANYIRSLGIWAAAGAIGAGITAMGIPLAMRRSFSLGPWLATTAVGATAPVLWFYIFYSINSRGDNAIYAIWQPLVAGAIGFFL